MLGKVGTNANRKRLEFVLLGVCIVSSWFLLKIVYFFHQNKLISQVSERLHNLNETFARTAETLVDRANADFLKMHWP